MPDPTGVQSHLNRQHRGIAWKEPCRVATTASITISTALNSGDTIDGVTLADGDRVLVKDQATGAENGIYVVSSSPTRAYDMDQDGTTSVVAEEIAGAFVYVIAGTANAGKVYHTTNVAGGTLGSTTITWTEFSGGTGLTDPMTTRGDIIVRNASNVTARLGVGGAGTFLASDGTDVSWGTGSGGTITTKDEGSTLSSSVTTLDFVGSGVVATGGGATTTVTISGGGGGLAASVLGYDTVGGSTVAATHAMGYAKKVTFSTTTIVQSVGVNMGMTTLAGTAGMVFLYADSGGSPSGAALAVNVWGVPTGNPGIVGDTPTTYTWWEFPLSGKYAAGDYWFGIMLNYQASSWNLHYDGSGTDKEITYSDAGFIEGITYRASLASASRKYSMRLLVLT